MSGGRPPTTVDEVRIIDRPRLRAVLDRSAANVVLLIGPAGYGKTTLARQWTVQLDLPVGWFQCTEASRDIAALALGLARSCAAIFPDAFQLLESRLRSATPEAIDAGSLADLLTREPRGISQRLLVLDDYHHLMRSGPAEQFVTEIVNTRTVRILICSRRRPSWATARRILYGEIEEIARGDLAMTRTEVAQVLGSQELESSDLLSLAGGWPAVIGLASRTRGAELPEARPMPNELYEFFAEELYQALPADLRDDLHRLVMLPGSAHGDLGLVFGSRTAEVTDELTRLGFLTPNEQAYATKEPAFDLHPLLREFVELKIAQTPRASIEREASAIAASLIDAQKWDEAFTVIQTYALKEFLPILVQCASTDFLRHGRLTTIDEWLLVAQHLNLNSPLIDLARAELLLRRGAWMQAIRLASDAADALGDDHPLASRALNCAARAAHFSDRSDLATALHKRALELAKHPEDMRESLWGKFIAENATDRADEARETLDAYDALDVCDGDDLIRRVTGRLVFATRHGPVDATADMAASSLTMLDAAKDPLTRTGFLQMLTFALVLAARYPEAKETALKEIEEAHRNRLDAIEIHALCALATAEIGLKELAAAAAALTRAERQLRGVDDVHARMNIASLRMRIALMRRDYEAAFREADQPWSRMPSVGIQGELLATTALVYVCAGKPAEARNLASAAERATSHIETRVTAKSVAAAALLLAGDDASVAAADAFGLAQETGAYDPFVVAYRSFPRLLGAAASDARPRLLRLLERVDDTAIAREFGLVATGASLLSPRERDVLELVAAGLSNRAIARALWISESTAKVHVRHIFEKLNVRTRTEAALKAREILPSSD